MTTLARSPRKSGLPPCPSGQRFDTEEAARKAKSSATLVFEHGDCGSWHASSPLRSSGERGRSSLPAPSALNRAERRAAEARERRNRSRADDTGFTAVQRLAVRTRAGNGDPAEASCEMCGIWLGRHGGQVHHRQNRQMGGSLLRSQLSNGLLACGTPLDPATCHGKATTGTGDVKRAMQAMGFVLETGQDPLSEPVMLHGQDGGVPVWLDDAAHYTDAQGSILAGRPREVAS